MTREPKFRNRASKTKADRSNVAYTAGTPNGEDYKVGPGRPPKQYQFKPGQSGNPKGAKRREPSILPDLKELFDRAFGEKVRVTQGERERVITMWGAGMRQLAVQFAKGNRDARRDAFWIAEKLGSEFLTPRAASAECLAEDRLAILDAYVDRQYDKVKEHKPVLAPPELLDDDIDDQDGA